MSFFKGLGAKPSFFGGGNSISSSVDGPTFSQIPPIMTSFLNNFQQSVYEQSDASSPIDNIALDDVESIASYDTADCGDEVMKVEDDGKLLWNMCVYPLTISHLFYHEKIILLMKKRAKMKRKKRSLK